jgi:NAD(P)-dependent dehydrogenase (short-subunit alcohol dehydrogenase family)
VVADIHKAGGRADAFAVDLAAPDGPHMMAKDVHRIVGQPLDIVVANAGVSKAAASRIPASLRLMRDTMECTSAGRL